MRQIYGSLRAAIEATGTHTVSNGWYPFGTQRHEIVPNLSISSENVYY